MDIIVAGQRIVTEAEYLEVAFGPLDVEPIDIQAELMAGGLVATTALADFLDEVTVESEVDAEDARYYRQLLRRMPRTLRTPNRRAVEQLVAEDDALGYEHDDLLADWTGADFDSYEVLAQLGATDPAASVAEARPARPTASVLPFVGRTVAPREAA
ncbi:hypothetical protein [Streptomyces albidoflavus]|uniref:hypothetical protein n=1 Tax=Streptomyces albidoflavus TaxID=1886 RepID=UPI00101E7C8C|nr:hypothetical protein [Streptomyces albidoflavus]RZD77140.1 hypothetical protein C0Q63_31865 [Streptomyces albidoflavus]